MPTDLPQAALFPAASGCTALTRDSDVMTEGDRRMLQALRTKIAHPFDGKVKPDPDLAKADSCLSGLVQNLFAHARRDIRLRRDLDLAPSADERVLLNLVAAAQAHEDDRADALARWMFKPAGREPVLYFANRLADAAIDLGWRLSLPEAPTPGGSPVAS